MQPPEIRQEIGSPALLSADQHKLLVGPPGSPTIQSVKGTLKELECSNHRLFLHLQTDSAKETIFGIVDPKLVAIENQKNGFVDWQCGALKPEQVTVTYDSSKASSHVDGELKKLSFSPDSTH